MKVIGITGGVGCGKSTILEYIKNNYNAFIIKTDDVGKQVLDKDTTGYNKVLDIFGDNLLDENKEIDRAKLASIVFSNKNKLMVLNSIVHPEVKRAVVEMLTKLKISEEFHYVFIESALLFDDHYEVFCDEIWYIYADVTSRYKRLNQERNYSNEKIDEIISNQLSEKEFREKSDLVIDNSHELSDTILQIKKRLEN